ncbi:hypothetical protein [Halorarius halobius]|uniref:hypothetical protein n=1 Tax=Halorarius halobius TaxID=2962671 RepID=UPI0020CB845A|nr:hypothetical protein [Halorarius halobius]
MADLAYTATAVLMTAFVLAVVGAVLRFRHWESYAPTDGAGLLDRLDALKSSPAVWGVTFLLLVFAFGGAAVVWVSGMQVPGAGMVGVAMAALGGVVIAGYLFVGVYSSARSRGRPAAWGVAEGAMLVGLAIVLAIAAKLVV